MNQCDMCGKPDVRRCNACGADLCVDDDKPMNHYQDCAWSIHKTNTQKGSTT